MPTNNSTAFESKDRNDGSGKTDIYFNHPSDKDAHGHVVESRDSNDNVTYHYVRDVEGNVYVNDSN